MHAALDALVRRIDEDRWLASRFAPAQARAGLIALYALNYEIARTAESVTQEALGDMRLAWWSEAIGEVYAGKPARAHPALHAFAPLARVLPQAPLEALIDARGADLDAAPFATWRDLEAYVDATSGALIGLAMTLCAPLAAQNAEAQALARAAGRAWAFAGLLRAAPVWAARGRSFIPRDKRLSGDAAQAALAERARAAHAEARARFAAAPSVLFPAVGYAALVSGYADAPEKPRALLARQLRLVAAAASGRL